MKIEKLNDRQIRCTLTKADLADRQLKLSELAYGTDKAKALFKDMVRQASIKFGFEAEDIPLMIEAVPLNSDCIVLIITKVEDPEELDTRFSRFAPSVMEDDDENEDNPDVLDHAPNDKAPLISGEILELFNKIKQEAASIIGNEADISVSVTEVKPETAKRSKKSDIAAKEPVTKIFSFDTLSEIITPAGAVRNLYSGDNTLYKDGKNDRYMLVINKADDKEAFNKTCNIMSEYGRLERLTPVSEAFFDEHFEVIIANNALERLAKIQ